MIPGQMRLVLEEGLQSAWLYETLSPRVDEIVVTGATGGRGRKSDKRYAYGLPRTCVWEISTSRLSNHRARSLACANSQGSMTSSRC